MKTTLNEEEQKAYADYVKQITPTKSLPLQVGKAFLAGGTVCALGQLIRNAGISYLHLSAADAASVCSILLILLADILTCLHIFPMLVNFGGAGLLVPITGFANSVCAPAIEFKKEGQVYGIGCKIFTIAGPVILYGLLSSFLLGLISWLFGL